MMYNKLRNEDEESEEFLAVLQASLTEAGMEGHPCASFRWQHHAAGVTRTLGLLSNLEPQLDWPLSEVRVLDLGCASGSASVAFALPDVRRRWFGSCARAARTPFGPGVGCRSQCHRRSYARGWLPFALSIGKLRILFL